MTLTINQRVWFTPPNKEPIKATVKKLWKSGKSVTITTQDLEVKVVAVEQITPVDGYTVLKKSENGFTLSEVRVTSEASDYPNQEKTNELSNLANYYWYNDDKHSVSLRKFTGGECKDDPYCEDIEVLIKSFKKLLEVTSEDLPILLRRGDAMPTLVEYIVERYKQTSFLRSQLAHLGVSKSEINKRLGDKSQAIASPNQPIDYSDTNNKTFLVRVKDSDENYPNQEKSTKLSNDPNSDDQENDKPSTRYWYEDKYVTKNGKQCGPYRYKRWVENGRRKSEYIGKVKDENVA